MPQLPSDISYDQWIEHVFDHPADPHQKRWWFNDDAPRWDVEANSSRALRYVTMFFKNPRHVRQTYSPSQIDQGLTYIVDGSASETMHLLRDKTLPLQAREACILAMFTLYTELMAKVYPVKVDPHHHDPQRPNYACHMWWDIIPYGPGLNIPSAEVLEQAAFRVFRSVLTLKSESCLRSAIHGLGHWQMDRPREVTSIIRHFLRIRTDVSEHIRSYAQDAEQGEVL